MSPAPIHLENVPQVCTIWPSKLRRCETFDQGKFGSGSICYTCQQTEEKGKLYVYIEFLSKMFNKD